MKQALMMIAVLALATPSTTTFANPTAPPAVFADLRKACAAEYQADFNLQRAEPALSHLSSSDIRLGIDENFHSVGELSLAGLEKLRARHRDSGPLFLCAIDRRMAVLRGQARLGQAPATSQSASAAAVAARNKAAANAAAATSTATSSTRSRVIAGDGKSAMHCVSIERVASGNSALSGGGKVIVNRCGETVETVWCYVNGDCNTTGAQVTLQANKSWPIDAVKDVRFAACLGKNTVRFEDGSKGLRYVCNAPR